MLQKSDGSADLPRKKSARKRKCQPASEIGWKEAGLTKSRRAPLNRHLALKVRNKIMVNKIP